MAPTTLSPLERGTTLSTHVLSQIKELLLSGQVMPGEQLSLRSTAQALGVSVMPVREAVYQLVADQALEVAPNRSVRVPLINAQQFHEITRLRMNLEGLAVEQTAANRPAPEQIALFARLNADLSREMAGAGSNNSRIVRLNKELHFAIYQAANMPMLLKIIESLWLRIGPIMNYDLGAHSERIDKQVAVGHHQNLIQALEQGNPEQARKALEHDIESAFKSILATHFDPGSGQHVTAAGQ
jgi:DNA-binding GntR family transcriptional regulator